MVEVLDGEAVAQGVRTYPFGECSSFSDGAYYVLNAANGDASGVGFSRCAGEEIIRRFLVSEVEEEVAANGFIVRKRSRFSALGFAYDEGSVVTIKIVQADFSDFASTQSESEDEAEDEAVFWGVRSGE